MSYALRRFSPDTPDSLTALIGIPSPTVSAGNYSYKYEFVMQRLSSVGSIHIGKDNGNRITFQDTGTLSFSPDLLYVDGNEAVWNLDEKNKFLFEIEYNTTVKETRAFLNDALVATKVITEPQAAFTDIPTLFLFASATNNQVTFDYFKFTDDNNPASNRHYLNTTGVGTVWPDISGNDSSATISNAAVDDSHWVFYANGSVSLTPTQPPQGGEVFSFSGSNYSAQPTGPMTFTQGTRVISRAVTISNWNATDGSFTGVTNTALPGVPAAGASDTPALLYGEPVTISLPDPGA